MQALPPTVFDRLAGVDLVLHAGDLDDPAILDELAGIAPVQAVRGNFHLQSPWPNDQRLPVALDLAIEGCRIVVSHGHLTLWNSVWEKAWLFFPAHRDRANRHMMARLARAFPGADVYVFGHSHCALTERRDGALFVNPGAVCPTPRQTASVAILTVTSGDTQVEIHPL
jgi:putative phosphoesterase